MMHKLWYTLNKAAQNVSYFDNCPKETVSGWAKNLGTIVQIRVARWYI
jgi:hypothetical protein